MDEDKSYKILQRLDVDYVLVTKQQKKTIYIFYFLKNANPMMSKTYSNFFLIKFD